MLKAEVLEVAPTFRSHVLRIPEGDSLNSRGQRPRKAITHEGLTLKGSN